MSRVINPDTAGRQRWQYQRVLILALRELMGQSTIDTTTYDLAAFVVLTLQAIHDTIDSSVAAWEKRDYWIKADRFRLQWHWAESYGHKLRAAINADNWAEVAVVAAQIALKLENVKVPIRNRWGAPWEGAWKKLSQDDLKSHLRTFSNR